MTIHPNNQSTNVEQFISGVIQLKGIGELSPDTHDALAKDLRERLDEYIMTKTIAALSEEDVASFEQLLDGDTSIAELRQFATEHIPDYQTFLASTLLEFQDVYLTAKD